MLQTAKKRSSICYEQTQHLTRGILGAVEAPASERAMVKRLDAMIEVSQHLTDKSWSKRKAGDYLKKHVYPNDPRPWWQVYNQYMRDFYSRLNVAALTKTPPPLRAYGVGNAITAAGAGQPVTDDEIRAGRLRPGAIVQLWYRDTNLGTTTGIGTYERLIRGKIGEGDVYGHSLFFVDYERDDDGKPIGMIFRDQNGSTGIHTVAFDETGWPLTNKAYMVATNVMTDGSGKRSPEYVLRDERGYDTVTALITQKAQLAPEFSAPRLCEALRREIAGRGDADVRAAAAALPASPTLDHDLIRLIGLWQRATGQKVTGVVSVSEQQRLIG